MSKHTVIIVESTESLKQSTGRDLISMICASFLIYISQGSTFWTFVSGSILLAYIISIVRTKFALSDKFESIEDAIEKLQTYVDTHKAKIKT